jgi:hypothetical protein
MSHSFILSTPRRTLVEHLYPSSLKYIGDNIIVYNRITWARERRLQDDVGSLHCLLHPHNLTVYTLQNSDHSPHLTPNILCNARRSYSIKKRWSTSDDTLSYPHGSCGRGRSNARRLLRHVRRIIIPCPPNNNSVRTSSGSSICRVSYDRRVLVRPRYRVRSVEWRIW